MKKSILFLCVFCLLFAGCATNPFTGKSTMAFVDNSELFPSAFGQYDEFLSQSTVIKGTAESEMVVRVGNKLRAAAEKWLAAENQSYYLDNYEWE